MKDYISIPNQNTFKNDTNNLNVTWQMQVSLSKETHRINGIYEYEMESISINKKRL